jgi:hypothetical protein
MMWIVVAVYRTVGLVCGLMATWELTLDRKLTPAPGIDIAYGLVAVLVAVSWPVWLIGWNVWQWQAVRIHHRPRPKMPRWLRLVEMACGFGVLLLIALIMEVRP